MARLSPDASIEQAQAAVDALWTRLETETAESRNSTGTGWGSRLIPLLEEQLGYYRPALWVLFGAVGLLLVIGVLNGSYLALAIPVAVLTLFVLGLTAWVGYTIATIQVEADPVPELDDELPEAGGAQSS